MSPMNKHQQPAPQKATKKRQYSEVFGDADTQTGASVGKQLKLNKSPGKNFKMGEMINKLGEKARKKTH